MAKKKTANKIAATITTLVLVALLAVGMFYQKKITRFSYKAYRWYQKSYGLKKRTPAGIVNFPEGYSVYGIDISHFQDDVDWGNLKAKNILGDTVSFRFVFMKATEGVWSEDVAFEEFWDEAKSAKITRGAYHYFLPDKDAKRQANNFISSVKLESGDLPPVIDIEETRGKTKAEIVSGLKEMLKILEKKYGIKPIIYSNISFIEDNLLDDFSDYNFWVAHYYQEELRAPSELKWLFWQFTDKAATLGCEQPVDANVFFGTKSLLKEYLVK